MTSKIVLISDDKDFFDYIKNKLELRKSDELFTFSFDSILNKIHLLDTSLLIINAENQYEKALELVNLFKNTPVIVTAYNDDSMFMKKCFRAGAIDFISLLTPDSEFRAKILPALNIVSLLNKNKQYRNLLIKNNLIDTNNEVFLNYERILDSELENIQKEQKKAVFMAISPSDKSRLKLTSNNIETIILNNIRKNDILMNYAPNKYFLILFDIDINYAHKLWTKINKQFNGMLFAGITTITNQNKQQLINEILNKLHQSINYDKNTIETDNNLHNSNFKLFKIEFEKNFKQTLLPAFYQIQQKFQDKLNNLSIEQDVNSKQGIFIIKTHSSIYEFKISHSGFSKINIDITYKNISKILDQKRIVLELEEFEIGLIQDLLEQFILEYRKEVEYDI